MAWRLLACVLTAAIGVLPVAPPEHVHDLDHGGHHQTLAHRHTGGHSRHDADSAGTSHDGGPSKPAHHDLFGGHDDDSDAANHDAGADHGRDAGDDRNSADAGERQRGVPATSIDDEDSVVAALSAPTWTQPSLGVPDAPATAVVAWILPPAPATRVGHIADVERLIHGPPRPVTSLRGPPVLSRL